MGLGPWHLMAIVIIVLVFFGPSRLPSLGKSMGEAIRGFKKGIDGDEIDVTESTQRRENLSAGSQASRQNVHDRLSDNEPRPNRDKTRS